MLINIQWNSAVIMLIFLVEKIVSDDLFVSNLDEQCIQCLCSAASMCNIQAGCESGYCGPFQIEKRYWVDAGRPVIEGDDPNREGAYESCAINYNCSVITLKRYISNFGSDCNVDGVTNCEDYAMLNFNGRNYCDKNILRNAEGREYMRRYLACKNSFLRNNIFLTSR